MLQNADACCSDVKPVTLTAADANYYRNIIYSRLRHHMTSATCAAMQCSEPQGQIRWTMCENCLLWHHSLCANISEPVESWYCALCTTATAQLRR